MKGSRKRERIWSVEGAGDSRIMNNPTSAKEG
jgi:hypothetical protein